MARVVSKDLRKGGKFEIVFVESRKAEGELRWGVCYWTRLVSMTWNL